jgi:hypothetical protein
VLLKFSPAGKLLMTIGQKGVHSDSGCINGNFKTVIRGSGPFYCLKGVNNPSTPFGQSNHPEKTDNFLGLYQLTRYVVSFSAC